MPRKKVFEEEQEEEFEWDKPRIVIFFIAVAILIAGGIFAKHYFLDSNNQKTASIQQSVAGLSIGAESTSSQLPTKQDIEQKLGDIQKQAESISVKDIASSSPQVKEILKQLQQLPKLPGNIAKQACLNICKSL